MKRREFCNLISGTIVISKAGELLQGLKKDVRTAFSGTGAPAAEGGRYAPLRARHPWVSRSVPALPSIDWERLLGNKEIRFLTDNQLSAYTDSEPGISQIHFFPVRERPKLVSKLDYTSLTKESQSRRTGPRISFQNSDGTLAKVKEEEYQWQPHKAQRLWRGNDFVVKEELAVYGNCAALRLTRVRGSGIKINIKQIFSPPEISSTQVGGHSIFMFREGVWLAPYVWGDSEITLTQAGYEATGTITEPILILLSVGYRPEDVIKQIVKCKEAPDGVFEEAQAGWDSYFSSMVPRIESSDERMVRVYYYLFYVVRSSLFNIPWEPYVYAYTCPWKTGAIWQWSWNTPMNAITERWLNDASFAKQGIGLIRANHGAAYIGTYLHPVRKQEKQWNIYDWDAATEQAQKSLETKNYDFLFRMPYTVPNSFLGIWEVYLMTGDRDFLIQNLPIMEDYECSAREHAPPGSLLTPFQFMVDEFDYSLRWKPVQEGFVKGGRQRPFDVPLLMVDFNAYLVELRRILCRAYLDLGQAQQARAMEGLAKESAEEINQRLWNDRLNFYCDVRYDNGLSTGVRAVSGFTPLYAQIVPPHRKARLLQALDDPQGFGSPFPLPSVELRNPDLDPNLLTYGGDSLITSGVWMIVNALVRNAEEKRAARYIHKAIEMVAKDGVSSAYSYNPIKATPNQAKHTLATQCAILNDLILRYIVGFTPRADLLFEFNPIALDPSMNHLKWGPFLYKRNYTILVEWTQKEYTVSVNGASLRFPKPTHVVAELDSGGKLRTRTAM
jgi:Mannosylglycerate hydrolase MGH1-like glycoside hydrolase domain